MTDEGQALHRAGINRAVRKSDRPNDFTETVNNIDAKNEKAGGDTGDDKNNND